MNAAQSPRVVRASRASAALSVISPIHRQETSSGCSLNQSRGKRESMRARCGARAGRRKTEEGNGGATGSGSSCFTQLLVQTLAPLRLSDVSYAKDAALRANAL